MSSLGVPLEEMSQEDPSDSGFLVLRKWLCGVAGFLDVLFMRSLPERIIKVADRDQGLYDRAAVTSAQLRGAREQTPLPDAPPDGLRAAVLALCRSHHVDQLIVEHRSPPNPLGSRKCTCPIPPTHDTVI